MLSLKKDKKEEEDKDGGNQYSNLEKTSVLQEARYDFFDNFQKWREESRYNFIELLTRKM